MFTTRSFRRDEGGNMAVTFALAILPITFAAGAALDFTRVSSERSKLQAVADRAAIAATLPPDATDEQRKAIVNSFFPPPPPPVPGAPVPVDALQRSAVAVIVNDGVNVTATSPVQASFAGILGVPSLNAQVTSQALRVATGRPVCLLALHPTARDAILFSGSTAVVAEGCAVHANSTSGSAISQQGASTAKAWSFCAVGGVSSSGGLTSTNTNAQGPKGGCFRQKDPFKDLPRPATGLCTNQTTNVTVNPNQTKTLEPGTYCNGLTLKGTVTLKAGTYVIKGGPLTITSQATVTGEGVTFYLTDSGASFDINGGGSVRLTAPTSGSYANMLVMQDASANPGATNKLNGNSTTHVKGAIYAPTQTITLTGSSGFGSTSGFMPLVASQLVFTGNSTTQADVANHPTPAPLPLSELGARLSN